VPDDRLAALVPPGLWARLTSMPPRFMIDALWPRSVLHRSLVANPGTTFYVDPEHVIVRELEVPSGGAVRLPGPSPPPTEPSPLPAGRSHYDRRRWRPSQHQPSQHATATTTHASGLPQCLQAERGVEWDWSNFLWAIHTASTTNRTTMADLFGIYKEACAPAGNPYCTQVTDMLWTVFIQASQNYYGVSDARHGYLQDQANEYGVDY
jgi:hypothetical protein